jgi:2-methylisocitrate lyase-like PEP mutase family enzyme
MLQPDDDGIWRRMSWKAKRFSELHVKGTPLVLYNAWDAGSAKSILEAGALAIATSSWAVAKAQGYQDGEAIPVEFVEQVAARIVATIDVPVTVDFEGGYSDVDDDLAGNVARLLDLDLGVIGINFEDRVVKGSGLYDYCSPGGAHRRDTRHHGEITRGVLYQCAHGSVSRPM